MKLLRDYRVIILALLGLLTFVTLVAASGCEKAPVSRLVSAQEAIQEALEAKAKRYAPRMLEQAEMFLRWGHLEMARQKSRLGAFRDYNRADSLFRIADSTAHAARSRSLDSLSSLREIAAKRLTEVQADISDWRLALNRSLAKLNFRHDFYAADMAHATGRELFKAEEFEEALESFQKAEWALGRIEQHMEELEITESQKMPVWRAWVNETLAHSRARGSYAVIVDKSDRKAYLVRGGRLVHSYNCDLGYNSGGQKMRSGDGATPEGKYYVTDARPRGSKYYKALNINYPNDMDKRRFEENKRKGIIPRRAAIGGLIEIHGHGGQNSDWTDGCVALTNKEMDHLMQFVGEGTPVTIVRKSDKWP